MRGCVSPRCRRVAHGDARMMLPRLAARGFTMGAWRMAHTYARGKIVIGGVLSKVRFDFAAEAAFWRYARQDVLIALWISLFLSGRVCMHNAASCACRLSINSFWSNAHCRAGRTVPRSRKSCMRSMVRRARVCDGCACGMIFDFAGGSVVALVASIGAVHV